MAYDLRPYIQSARPTNGQPGNGVDIKIGDFYLFPKVTATSAPAALDGLPVLNQPFADPYQAMEIMVGIWRSIRKEIRRLESTSAD